MKRNGGRYALVGSTVTHGILVVLLWGTLSLAARPSAGPAEVFSNVADVVPLEDPIAEPLPEPPAPAAEPDLPTLPDEAPPEEPDPFRAEPDLAPMPGVLALPGHPVGPFCPIPRPRRAPLPAAEVPTPSPVAVAVATPSGPSRSAKPAPGNPAPRYPERAVRSGLEGIVMLEVTVSAGGDVVEVTVKESSGSRLLDREAVRTVTNWRFLPALRRGRKVGARIEVPIRFRLD
jgi:protein TonB